MDLAGYEQTLARAENRILRHYEDALLAHNNALITNPETAHELMPRASAIIHDVIRSLGKVDLPSAVVPEPVDRVGRRRARQSVHPSESLSAATILFETSLPVLASAIAEAEPGISPVEVANCLHREIMRRVVPASVQYVDTLLEGLSAAHQEERRNIARHLHDSVAHGIAAGLQRLELSKRADADRSDALLDTALELLRETLEQVHEIAYGLRVVVGERTLEQALRDYIDDLPEGGPPVSLTCGGPEAGLSPRLTEEVFLITREAIANARKHAETATRIDVTRVCSPAGMRIAIADDGCGFDAKAIDVSSLGLWSMAERAAAVGVALTVHSQRGQGTLVTVQAPLERRS